MTQHKLSLLGFGNVGRALARLLLEKADDIEAQYDITYFVTGIATGRSGMAVNPDGIDLNEALARYDARESLDTLSTRPVTTPFDVMKHSGANIMFENTPVSYHDGQPAIDYIRYALTNGMSVSTANKGPIVHAYHELTALAKEHGTQFLFESTVMDGAPIFSLYRETLPAARLRGFRGVLNSTTNLILSRMETGESFEEAVKYAQAIGIAETDPSGDVDGWDAAIKVSALATVLMDVPTKPQNVDRTGIGGITQEKIAKAKAQGKRWKLVCSATRTTDGLVTKVAPEMVGPTSPMYGIEGTTSIVQFESDVLGLLSVLEEDPGPHTTAYGLLADFLNMVRRA